MIKKIAVTAGNWIWFRVFMSNNKNPSAIVKYHPSKSDLECSCSSLSDKPCDHITWLAREFTYDKTFEDIRALIMKEAGVDYEYTVIEDLWDKCLKVTNSRLYESLKQGTRTERNPLKFKLERESTFGVDTSSKADQTALVWLGTVSGSDQQWRVEQYSKNKFMVRMVSLTNQDTPWRSVERLGSGNWKSNCACPSGQGCIHEMAAKTAYAAWFGDGIIDKQAEKPIFGYLTKNDLISMTDFQTDFQKELLDSISFEIKNNLFDGNTAIATTTSTSGEKTEWVYMGPKAWGTKVFQSPYIKGEQQEPEPTEKPTEKPTEEPKPPQKPKSRFSEMEL